MNKKEIIKSFLAGFYSCITIGILTLLTYKTDLGIFLIASFGASMVMLYGYPESPFAQPKNIVNPRFISMLWNIYRFYNYTKFKP